MYIKNNTLYADAFKYLKRKGFPSVALQVSTSDQDNYEELPMTTPLKVEVVNGKDIRVNDWFVFRPPSLDYAEVKTYLVKLRYTNDDQIALMLNKDDSEEKAELYKKMQAWRDFAGEVAERAMEFISFQ